MPARRTTTLLLALAVAGLSACGSSNKSASTATTQSAPQQTTPASTTGATGGAIEPAFIARVNALCTKANAELAPKGKFPYSNFNPTSPDVSLLPKVAAFFEGLRPVLDRVPVALKALGAPRQGASEWSQLVALVPQYRAIADRQIAAAKASDSQAFVKTVDEISTIQERITRLALGAGFAATSPCSELF